MWNGSFSPVQVGKEHLYQLLREMGLTLHLREGWQTKELRERYRLQKTKSKSGQSFDSHAVDAWVLAASISGAEQPTCRRLWYVIPAQLHRRHGLCTVGGFDRTRQTISLHAYHTNKRLTQGAKVKDCQIRTWVAFRSWLVSTQTKKKGDGASSLRLKA
jgi:hypothetical protein